MFAEVFRLFWMSEARAVNPRGISGRIGLRNGASRTDQLTELGFHLSEFG